MRDAIAAALKEALKAKDKRRVCTLRLIHAAVTDRDIANRGAGKDPVSDEDILLILAKMVKQREESAKAFEDGARLDMADQERQEIAVIREFLPRQLCEDDTRAAVRQVIDDIGAEGLRDMGRCMAALKERYPGQMDFAKANGFAKTMLQ
ncbi:glutamyl-tRNA amidotransferase [Zhengella mangrovi]|uniref:Glutamyl-tRNA amidotransferase n=1 Tax=Zhengella mangrovi TaxID=1982044 RepID=A0A2G1QH88_9HYPH|nr:GatB/YqeY domain-containing protein [Zhengella mangrovi]PHP64876.1 glutamyl-tRNA amidotransferase [Zhengella mangrovi]